MVASLSGYYQSPELDSKMPGHDHSLRKLYTIEGLSNPSMVYNWICPMLLKEDCPYEALARIFSTYFKDTSGINTSEDYLNFGWAAPLFSESDWSTMKHHTKKNCTCKYIPLSIFLTLKIAVFCNLVLLNVCKHFSLLTLLYSLRVSAVLDHFGYPAPHLNQWQQCVWYDLGATQEVLYQMHIRLSRGLPTIASPPRAESPSPSRRPAAVPIHPTREEEFVKASKGGSSAPQHHEHWAIPAYSDFFS